MGDLPPKENLFSFRISSWSPMSVHSWAHRQAGPAQSTSALGNPWNHIKPNPKNLGKEPRRGWELTGSPGRPSPGL